MSNIKIHLRRGKDESLRRYHPWIFSGAVHHIDGSPEEGDIADVYSADGDFLCRGHWQIGSIAVRVLTWDESASIDTAFWQARLAEAWRVRHLLGLVRGDEDGTSRNDTFRLVHGEGDNLPGLVIDMYADTAVIQAHSVGMHRSRHDIARALKAAVGDGLKNIYYKSESTLPFKADLHQENEFLLKTCEPLAVSTENGLRFRIDWLKGQKTGFFVDQRNNRSLLEHYSKGRKVLNMFCYTGGFSVYAMRGGAELVHSVDSSAKAVDLATANVEMNFPGETRHKAFAEDAFKFLDEMTIPYDLVILDPPAFAKHRDALRNALKGYTRLNAKAMEKMQPGGILFTFSCSQAVDKDQFRTAVFTAATLARKRVRILHQLHQPEDHPVSIYHPEGEYLKGLVLQIEDM